MILSSVNFPARCRKKREKGTAEKSSRQPCHITSRGSRESTGIPWISADARQKAKIISKMDFTCLLNGFVIGMEPFREIITCLRIGIIYYNILLTFYEQILLRRTTADQTWLICRADEIHGMRRENSDAKNWRGADGDGKKKNKEGLAGILDYPWGAGGGDFYF